MPIENDEKTLQQFAEIRDKLMEEYNRLKQSRRMLDIKIKDYEQALGISSYAHPAQTWPREGGILKGESGIGKIKTDEEMRKMDEEQKKALDEYWRRRNQENMRDFSSPLGVTAAVESNMQGATFGEIDDLYTAFASAADKAD